MPRTYRDIAIEGMLGTVEEAMSQVINWWGDLPLPMKEAIEQFRVQLGAQSTPWNLFKRRSTDKHTRGTVGKALPDIRGCVVADLGQKDQKRKQQANRQGSKTPRDFLSALASWRFAFLGVRRSA